MNKNTSFFHFFSVLNDNGRYVTGNVHTYCQEKITRFKNDNYMLSQIGNMNNVVLKFQIYFTSHMNPDISPNRILLDVSVSSKKNFKIYNKHLILIRL